MGVLSALVIVERRITVDQIKKFLESYDVSRVSDLSPAEFKNFEIFVKLTIHQLGDTAVSNTMSKDRIRFTITGHAASKGGCAYKAIISKAFGHHISEHVLMCDGIDIVCRPSQFARFMIYRSEAIKKGEINGCNTFTDLNAELFIPEPPRCQPVDVSKNPATHRSC
jgi:hypothetical protein